MELQTYFNQKYQGSDSFLHEVIFPIFGAENFENGYNVDVLKGDDSLQQTAKVSGVTSVLHIGQIGIPFNPIDVFDITVTDHVQMARNRVAIQQLVRRIMNTYSGAFMIFHYDSEEKWDWRFSFCNKRGNNDEITESKRYTYLLGPNQACRTAAERFQTLADKTGAIEIDDIVNAFDVEALTQEFFEKYKARYTEFVRYMSDEANGMRADFIDRSFDRTGLSAAEIRVMEEKPIRDYVKRLLGRIVFVYFLQKKGWMGILPDESWGKGDPDFLRNLFHTATPEQQEDFLDTVLEPLFNGGFDTDRSHDNDLFDTGVKGLPNEGILKIPYLNGGLFERDALDLPPSRFPAVFFEKLFDFFSQYNFTIDENDPDDAQVGVDPEMLGRIFENLLEDNKDKGAFYTPKEIVQFMCRESLIAYLQTDVETDEAKEAVRHFVFLHNAEQLDDSLKQTIDRKLKKVRICDPAIGSGAFPMGLLKELFLCRGAIEQFDNAAEIKKHIIQQNIYGVDIEKGAVDIARLRFWLSLIVDEKTPHALPNMDFKIMQGNSLLESYAGIDLKKLAACSSSMQIYEPQRNIFGEIEEDRVNVIFTQRNEIAQLHTCISQFFQEHDHGKRERLRNRIEELLRGQMAYNIELKLLQVERQIRELSATSTPSAKQSKALSAAKTRQKELRATQLEVKTMRFPNDQFFLWHTYFHDVFEQGGFDIVIGNPPYIQLQNKKGALAKLYEKESYNTFARSGDIYCLFYEMGWNLLKEHAFLCYITSNKWMRAGYGEPLRGFLAKQSNPILLIDFAGVQIFDAATVDTNILLLQKAPNAGKTLACATKSADCRNNLSDYFLQNSSICSFRDSESWIVLSPIELSIKRKIEAIGTPLKNWNVRINYGIKTGYNPAFIIDGKKRAELIAADPKSAEIIRPILRGRDIKRYNYEFDDSWLINTHNGIKDKDINRIDIDDYPAIKTHLDKFWDQISTRADKGDTPYNLRNCAYMDDFNKQKIVWGNLNLKASFALAGEKIYISAPATLIVPYSKYLLAVLNSKIADYYIRRLGVTRNGGYFEYKPMFIEKLPVPLNADNRAEINRLIDLKLAGEDVDEKLDQEIFKLYHISTEEIKVIERN